MAVGPHDVFPAPGDAAWRRRQIIGEHRAVTQVNTRPPLPRRVRWRRVGVLAVVASFVGIWGYVMYLSFFVGRQDPRDHLDDTAWIQAAEATCAPTAAAVADEPFANELDSPAERADVLDDATTRLEAMVRRLRPEPARRR